MQDTIDSKEAFIFQEDNDETCHVLNKFIKWFADNNNNTLLIMNFQ